MLKEFLKFRLSKLVSASLSGLALGLIFSLAEVECWSCGRQKLLSVVPYFLIFTVIIFVIVWIAHSFTISLKK